MNIRRLTPLCAIALALAVGACSKPVVNEVSATTAGPAKVTATDGSNATTSGPATTEQTGEQRQPGKQSGAITLVALGDSLTAGQGEDSGLGFPGRLQEAIDKAGHPGSTVVNLGRSGWDSKQLINGAEGDRSQLVGAQEAMAEARQAGTPVIATVLIGSNDLTYLYSEEGTTTEAQERANLDEYRANLQRIVTTLKKDGAQVVMGINDDQSKRPIFADRTMRENFVYGMTEGEVKQMSAQAKRYAEVVRDVAKDNGALIADFFDAALFSNSRTLNEDGGHPNKEGYDEMAKVWLAAMQPLL